MSKHRKSPHLKAGHLNDHPAELLARVLLSRERLAQSDLGRSAQAWRVWSACIAATADHGKAADQTYVATLAEASGVRRQEASQLLRRFNDLGVVAWPEPATPGSRDARIVELPSDGVDRRSTPTSDGVDRHYQVIGNEVVTTELNTASSDIDKHRSSASLVGSSEQASKDWEAERHATESQTPAPDPYDWDAFDAEVDTAWRAAQAEAAGRFPPFHGDERTGDGVGDDEASQLRWQGANPSKTRQARKN